jgi:RNA recognition motif-containing protein
MNAKIHVENLAADTKENELMDLFSAYGNVANVNIAFDQVERKSRCFGCVTMATAEGAQAAIQALNGKVVGTATLTVSEWRSGQGATLPNGRRPLRSTSKLY